MKESNQEDDNKETHVTIKLDRQLNNFIEKKAKESLRNKRHQIVYMLMQLMRKEG